MVKRVSIVALVVAVFLVLAVPALAFNGYRGDYTTSGACAACHSGIAGIPAVYGEWAGTKHAVAGADNQALRLPYGSVCQGCHTSNFAPAKVVPTPTATSAGDAVSWGAGNGIPTQPQSVGSAASSENYVGCSSCHYGANVGGDLATSGVDSSDTAHNSPFGLLANAEICGQCHSRYAYTTGTFAVQPIPTPTASQTTLIQPQMALGGYKMLGSPSAGGWTAAAALSTVLNVQFPGWSPTPNPAATSAGFTRLQTYWKDAAGNDLPWQQTGHDGSAAQYPDWAIEGHAAALTGLTSQPFWGSLDEAAKQECLMCHSADFRIMKEAGKTVASSDARYGITCVGCHTPHTKGTAKGAWDEEWTPQLATDSAKTLCIQCHTGEIPAGEQATPGTEIHHPMKEMIDGYGAIGVAQMPSVHKGKCVQCHMPPTSYSRGSVQLGGNHTFTIIEPEVAADASPVPIRTTTPTPGTTVVTQGVMPYSACSTCHASSSDPLATYVQDTLDQRQEWTAGQIARIWAELNAAAGKLGFADATAAQQTIAAISESSWTTNQRSFLSGFTNVEFVESEGSFGIHNWDYTVAIVDKAHDQAQAVTSDPWKVTVKRSKGTVKRGAKVKFKGTVKTSSLVAGAGKVTLQRKKGGGGWKNWTKVKLKSNGAYAKTIKMTSKGKWFVRARMPGNASNLSAYSSQVKVIVK